MYWCLRLRYARRDRLQSMEKRERPRMHIWGKQKIRIMMAAVRHVTYGAVRTKFPVD